MKKVLIVLDVLAVVSVAVVLGFIILMNHSGGPNNDQKFVKEVRKDSTTAQRKSDTTILAVGYMTCSDFSSGSSASQVYNNMLQGGISPSDAVMLMNVATKFLCPEYVHLVNPNGV